MTTSKKKRRKKNNSENGPSFLENVGITSAVNAAVNGAVNATYAAWENGKAVRAKETSLKDAATNVMRATVDAVKKLKDRVTGKLDNSELVSSLSHLPLSYEDYLQDAQFLHKETTV